VLIDAASGTETATIYHRADLAPEQAFDGPAIIEQPDTTTLVPRGWRCRATAAGILLLEPSSPG
jgi:N-methylhydantoinase A/oxoprolinase/acetone carboxylase beta subunit